jgi:hypothetical protein
MALSIRGNVKFKTTPGNGDGDPVLARDASTGELGLNTTALSVALLSGQIIVGNASNIATPVTVTGDITVSNTGLVHISTGAIVNLDINAAAGINFTKMESLTVSRALVTNSSGIVTPSSTTATEIGYVSGVTSAIQTQLDGKQATITGAASTITSSNLTANRALIANGSGKVAISSTTSTELGYLSGVTGAIQNQLDDKLTVVLTTPATGDILYIDGSGDWVNRPVGTNGQVLTLSGGVPVWANGVSNGIPSGGTTNQYLVKNSNANYDTAWATLTLSKITDVSSSAGDLNLLNGLSSTISTTELSYLDGVTSNIQTQLNSKLASSLAHNALFVGDGSNQATELAPGSNGQVLTSVAGVPQWQTPSPPGDVSSATDPSIDNELTRFNGTTGKSIQGGTGIVISDAGAMSFPTGGALQTGTGSGNTLLIQAYDVNDTTYRTWATLTAGNTPTYDINTDTTIGAAYIYRASGTDVAVADGGTNISSYATGDILYASGATTLTKLPVSTNGFVLTLSAGLPVWAAPSGGGGGSLTATYVGYGDGANTLTGEAAFTYDATNNKMQIDRINYNAQGSDPGGSVANGDLIYNSTTLDLRSRINGQWSNVTRPEVVIESTTTRTLTEADRNKIIYCTNGSTVTITGPNLSVGFVVTIVKSGAGDVVFDPDTGLTLEAIDDTISTQYGWATFIQQTATVWTGSGALGTSSGGGTVTSVTGTSNRITISGTATDPIVDIAATYVGQSSITTLGTIGTGTWQGTAVGTQYGGTGANLSATGGAGQYVKQTSVGGAFTVGTIPASDIASPAALTKTDDTNVTLTLGGSPSTSLLAATSLTLGWTGQLDVTRGGTGLSSVTQGDILYGSAVNTISVLAKNTSSTRYLSNTGSSNNPAWAQVDLTNGVSGVLPATNGGTGISSLGTGVATWLGTPSWTNFNTAITGTAPYWALTGTSTLTGVTTITSNVANQLAFGGTWTATSSAQHHLSINPSITARATASDTINAVTISPTITAAANTQTLVTLDLTTSYIPGAFSGLTNISIRANGQIENTLASGGENIKLINNSTGNAAAIAFYRSSTSVATISGTGSTASSPNALYFRTNLAAGNMIFATASNVVAMTISNAQKIGIGTASLTPTAWLHVQAGTASANTAPLKFTAGTNLTTPEAGAVEFDGTNYFVTSSTTRYTLAKTLTATATLDFGSISGPGYEDQTITVTGAADGDVVIIGAASGSIPTGVIFWGFVSATDTVTIRCINNNNFNTDPASGTFRATVLKY